MRSYDVCSTRENPFQQNGSVGLSSTVMIAFDTNLLMRLAVNDDRNQAEITPTFEVLTV
ncbi:MAG: hypothetical protein KJO08_01345 [Gammaproteobacteria bacterium]|nr:hypothetical protein [Gammaproteobacteria bacterium]